jgi:hypothetical protein
MCTSCEKIICKASDNIREHLAKSQPIPMVDYSPVNAYSPGPDGFLVHYYCPSCGTQLSVDCVIGSDIGRTFFELKVNS